MFVKPLCSCYLANNAYLARFSWVYWSISHVSSSITIHVVYKSAVCTRFLDRSGEMHSWERGTFVLAGVTSKGTYHETLCSISARRNRIRRIDSSWSCAQESRGEIRTGGVPTRSFISRSLSWSWFWCCTVSWQAIWFLFMEVCCINLRRTWVRWHASLTRSTWLNHRHMLSTMRRTGSNQRQRHPFPMFWILPILQ